MDDIYSNLENYNDEATLAELQNENKELKCKLEDYASNLDRLQKDFDKLSSEYKKLELNYSSLLKTARSEIERKTQHISNLNAEKDALVLKSLQNRHTRIFPYNKSNLPKTKEDEPRLDKKAVIESHNLEFNRKESIFSPKEDMVKSGTDSSTKENISHKKTNVEENKARSIRNRRKSMPGFGMPAAKFSSDEEDAPIPGRNLPPKEREYSDRNVDRNLKPSSRTAEGLDDRSYEKTRYYRNVETDKFRNHDRTDFSQRYKRDGSPGRHRRRPRDIYEDHQRMEHDKYRRHDSPIDKFSQYPRRPRSNYDRAFQEQERYKTRNQDRHTKHKISEYDEPKNKRFRPDSYTRYEEEKWCPEMQEMSEEFDKQYASCQSPDINFLEPNPNHPITEIKLTTNTQLEDPRKSSERYVVKQNEGKETIMAIRGINVDIAPIPIEKSSYNIESIQIPEALKEKPVTDDLINEIYKDVDNPQLNVSMESGEIPGDSQDIVLEYEIKDVSKNSKESSTKRDSINVNKQHTSYKIPKLKICKSVTQTDKNISVAFSVKHNDDNNDNTPVNKNNSKNVTKLDLDLKKDNVNVNDNAQISKEVPLPFLGSQTDRLSHEHINISNSVPKIDLDLKKDDINVKSKASISKQMALPLLSSQTDNLSHEHINISKNVPKINFDLKKDDTSVKHKKASISKQMPLPLLSQNTHKLNHEHLKTKAAMKMVEDDLELSDETCDTDMYKPKEKIIKTNTSSSEKRDYQTETKVITPQEKCNANNKKKDCKDPEDIDPGKDKKVKPNKRRHKEKNSPEEVKTKKSTEKLTKKKAKEKEVKTKEIATKFSELFGDSLISPEDLGLIAVQPPLNHPVAGIFEDAQDAVDVNIKETSLNSETLVDTTVVEVKKTDNRNNEVPVINSAPVSKSVPSIQSVYQNVEVSPEAEDGNIKTVIISTGVQPSTEVFNKPIMKILDQLEFPAKPPEQIGLKALATSTPLKLDNVQNLFKINPKIIEAHGKINDNRNESTDNDTSDVSNSNNELKTNDADVPDIRIFVKRRRKVIKK